MYFKVIHKLPVQGLLVHLNRLKTPWVAFGLLWSVGILLFGAAVVVIIVLVIFINIIIIMRYYPVRVKS